LTLYPYIGTVSLVKLEAKFFQTSSGAEPTRTFLKKLSKKDRAQVGAIIRKLQEDHQLEHPHGKNLGQGLWEIRTTTASGKVRVFYCFAGKEFVVLLHAILKKTQKTPKKDLDLAQKRKKIVEDYYASKK